MSHDLMLHVLCTIHLHFWLIFRSIHNKKICTKENVNFNSDSSYRQKEGPVNRIALWRQYSVLSAIMLSFTLYFGIMSYI